MFAAEFVELLHHPERSRAFVRSPPRNRPSRNSRVDDTPAWSGASSGDTDRVNIALVGRGKRVEPRVFEDAGLVRDVQKIAVHRIRLLRAGLHGDALLLRNKRSSPRGRETARGTAHRATARSPPAPARARRRSVRSAPGRCPCPSRRGRWHRAFSSCAISTMRLAISGRAMLVPRKYWPS